MKTSLPVVALVLCSAAAQSEATVTAFERGRWFDGEQFVSGTRLQAGYEASFLALEGDPLADFANVQRIALRVKRGRLLLPRATTLPPLGS